MVCTLYSANVKKIVWGLIFVFRGCSGLKVDNVGAMTSLKKPYFERKNPYF